jgi:molecular chaperone DnaK (HSP70)
MRRHPSKEQHMTKILIDEDVVKLALEALEAGEYYIDDLEAIVYAADDIGVHEDRAKMQAAITTLRKALAEQPAQRMWVGLTAEEIEAIGKPYEEKDRSIQAWGLFACAIESKLKEKNT